MQNLLLPKLHYCKLNYAKNLQFLQFSTVSNDQPKPRQSLAQILQLKHQFPSELKQELRSNHAGEVGAVFIYKGAQFGLKIKGERNGNEIMKAFVERHLRTEERHLEYMNQIVSKGERSKLVSVWKVAGFVLGALPTVIGGPKWFFITVEAVESFVEEHYQNQIKMLQGFISSGKTEYKELQGLLEECCNDEISHKDEAHIESKVEKKGLLARLWSFIVFQGSSSAVFVAKRI